MLVEAIVTTATASAALYFCVLTVLQSRKSRRADAELIAALDRNEYLLIELNNVAFQLDSSVDRATRSLNHSAAPSFRRKSETAITRWTAAAEAPRRHPAHSWSIAAAATPDEALRKLESEASGLQESRMQRCEDGLHLV
ncbi:Uncharacterised protein [Mycobacteroides abscessus subsp. bolletii]|nr:Uncharacterised protein [Mycobacteroides abscessus subsp. bolletii]SHS10665.1 Uncharacterised protein [Mycobacteroides abscessus subsp. bolletii]SHS80462.1 Uncharacterised protein [Mycobacteroides abscessus subsp. bolletii]SHS84214.1 Uncharacterised protein [Mycobacteroides abscessus subsp. bolletii]SHX73824.1 Uncharacterised protein [Mycobacteroides abscessus subsp. bolletii]